MKMRQSHLDFLKYLVCFPALSKKVSVFIFYQTPCLYLIIIGSEFRSHIGAQKRKKCLLCIIVNFKPTQNCPNLVAKTSESQTQDWKETCLISLKPTMLCLYAQYKISYSRNPQLVGNS